MPSSPFIRAIDIGYGNTKFIVDDQRHCKIMPSLAPRADAHRDRANLMRARRTTRVVVEGKAYEVGEDVGLFLTHVPVLHRDYTETPEYRALLYGALEAMHVSRVDLLVTGLPVHLHESRWQRLKSLLVGVHQIRPGVTVEVREAAVVVQPLGGFVAHSHERGNWNTHEQETTLIVDLGYYTVDWMVAQGLKELPGLSDSVECGVSEYIQCIGEQLSAKLGDPQSNLMRIDDGLRNGNLRVKGRAVPLESFHREAQRVVDRAIGALRNRVGSGQAIDRIVVVGGGAPYFVPGLQAAFPEHPMHTVADPVFANVRGFQLIGEYLRASSSTE